MKEKFTTNILNSNHFYNILNSITRQFNHKLWRTSLNSFFQRVSTLVLPKFVTRFQILSCGLLCLLVYSRIKLSSKGVECVSVCVSRVKWTKVRSSLRGRPPKINWRPKRSVRLDRVWIVLGFFTARCIDFNNCTSQ